MSKEAINLTNTEWLPEEKQTSNYPINNKNTTHRIFCRIDNGSEVYIPSKDDDIIKDFAPVYYSAIGQTGDENSFISILPDKDSVEDGVMQYSYYKEKPLTFFKDNSNITKDLETVENNEFYFLPPKTQFISKHLFTENEHSSNKNRYFFLDIEVYMGGEKPDPNIAKQNITLMQINDSLTNINYIFYYKDGYEFKNTENIVYMKCTDEVDMLLKFSNFVREHKPLALCAWFGDGFDFPYIFNRIIYLSKENSLLKRAIVDMSPYEKTKKVRRLSSFGDSYDFIAPAGIYCLDMMVVYRFNYTKNRKSWSLESVCSEDLGVGKVKYMDVSSNLDDLYDNHFDKFIEYGIQDSQLLYDLEQHTGYLANTLYLSKLTGVNFDEAMSTVMPWNTKIQIELLRDWKIIPPKANMENVREKYDGAHTFVAPGKKDWVVMFDVASMYPNSFITLGLSYETLLTPDLYSSYDREKAKMIFKKYSFIDLIIIKSIYHSIVLTNKVIDESSLSKEFLPLYKRAWNYDENKLKAFLGIYYDLFNETFKYFKPGFNDTILFDIFYNKVYCPKYSCSSIVKQFKKINKIALKNKIENNLEFSKYVNMLDDVKEKELVNDTTLAVLEGLKTNDVSMIEELRQRLVIADVVLSPVGALFRKDKPGILAKMVEKIFYDRKAKKKQISQIVKEQRLIDEILESRKKYDTY